MPIATDTKRHPYRPVTPAIVAELRAIVGEKRVIYADPDRMADYAHDEVAGDEYAHMPEVVVKPDGATQIAEIMRLANRERVPVTPRGAGSGLSGGAVPVFGGILLSLEHMNHILEIDLANMVAVVEPGVVTNDISEAARKHGLFYAGYPMSFEMCFIGGNVAENAGGGRAIKYGVTEHYVLGLEVVLPTGEIVQLGGKRVKDVTGYSLLKLMVGSEGTLGIFTRIILRLLPMPKTRMVVLLPFPDVPSAIAAVPRIMTRSGIVPASVEFMDRLSTETAYAYVGEKLPHRKMDALLLLEVDGSSREQVEADMETLVDLCLDVGALDAYVADSPTKIKQMWHPRTIVAEAFKALCPVQSAEDLVMPMAQIPNLMPELARLSEKYDVLLPAFGHVGDGNVHVHVIKRPETPLADYKAMLPMVLTELYEAVARLGGTISGEHGVGSKRARYLPLVLDPVLIDLQRRIKQAFDPLNILNPGKIFPEE